MIGIHLTEAVPVNQVITTLQNAGYLTLSARENTLRLLPPLIIDENHLRQAVDAIKLAIATQA
ncbi:Acetylornithine/succinyldiaminopimelate aminotransferase [Convivina praedatoris]|uniref:Acetylornithine/succinyldiaminopimelate aminotransferase n=2 Tax=Convivina praedatoris TaxID=2880963 RepID=A0ABN8HGY4_9LACO|nr:Acetylornithine/succinyldiaminopimelate aminotransferase [Convivina sp. LMG 32447]CAH1855254.1 Acetylornithine/succinyldiaminopimelate aminotransferase [Convivina sp. LMG 32447]